MAVTELNSIPAPKNVLSPEGCENIPSPHVFKNIPSQRSKNIPSSEMPKNRKVLKGPNNTLRSEMKWKKKKMKKIII